MILDLFLRKCITFDVEDELLSLHHRIKLKILHLLVVGTVFRVWEERYHNLLTIDNLQLVGCWPLANSNMEHLHVTLYGT